MANKIRIELYKKCIKDREITIKKIRKLIKKEYRKYFVKAIYYTEYIRCNKFIQQLEMLEQMTELPTDVIGNILINYLTNDF